MKKTIFLNIFLLLLLTSFAQNTVKISGYVEDEKGKPVDLVNVFVEETHQGAVTDKNGYFSLNLTVGKTYTLKFSRIGFVEKRRTITVKKNTKTFFVVMPEAAQKLNTVSIKGIQTRADNLIRINPKVVSRIPSPDESIESLLRTLPGVSSKNDLSSQYSVRGGNFDENLVYVNDIEVYRPFLVRSGQQEGLSFVNPDMVGSVLFSAGGFDAKYGDKMSSVLDIKYKKPYKFGGNFSLSFLGGGAHLEGIDPSNRLTYNVGIRYKTTKYLLKGLQEEGDYFPNFIDYQGFFTYDITEKWELDLFTNLSQNSYMFVPKTRETSFGTFNTALKLKIYFDGQEVDRFTSGTEAVSLNYKPNEKTTLKFISSYFFSREQETYDILGQYFLNEVDKDLGSDNVGDSLMNIGVGTFLNHARNYLDADVVNFYHRGSKKINNNHLQWGAKIQHELIADRTNEWEMLDSAGYSLPYSDTSVDLYYTLRAANNLESNRFTAYFQNTIKQEFDKMTLSVTAGIRTQYWSLNRQNIISPRVSLSLKPKWERDVMFRVAAGYYYQMPFYKEMRDMQGHIHTDISAQRSIHFVMGADYNLNIWDRPFKIISELYYKKLDFLIPYEVDNVQIRYYGTNNSRGYAYGWDFKINGEFVKGTESWASLSLMKTEEDILNDFYYDSSGVIHFPGYIPRPTDELVNFAMFFQDYLPGLPDFKMHLALYFSSGLPFGPPEQPKYADTLRMPSYKRVDLGFSYRIKGEDKELNSFKWLNTFKSVWVTLDVFNLLNIENTISYVWVKDIHNRQYAVPNYLTFRRINLKLSFYF
jgi:hypothetical protein